MSCGKAFFTGGRATHSKRTDHKKGTIVDSTIIAARTSTKNKERKRNSDAHQTHKGNAWYFGF